MRSALRVLRDEGLVVARQGKGIFVRSTYSPDGDTEAVTMDKGHGSGWMRSVASGWVLVCLPSGLSVHADQDAARTA